MIVSEQDVDRVAELANLELTGVEKVRMLHDLNSILDYVAQLNELDTASVPPMIQAADQWMHGSESDSAPDLRCDDPVPSIERSQVLLSAPDADQAFFKVPKVIER